MREPGFSAQPSVDIDESREYDFDAIYSELRDMFEIDMNASMGATTTLFGQCARNYQAQFYHDSDLTDPEVQKKIVVNTASGILDAVVVLESCGYEFGTVNDRGMGQRRQTYDAYENAWKRLGKMSEDANFDNPNDAKLYFAEQILVTTSGDRSSGRYRKHVSDGDESIDEPGSNKHTAVTDAIKQEYRFFSYVADHSDYARRASLLALERLSKSDVIAWLRYELEKADFEASMAGEIEEPVFKGQELDFTILPDGTNIREICEDILGRIPDHLKPYVDLDRLNILEEVRQLVGKEMCFYAQGKPKGREFMAENGAKVDESYIVLVMQDRDEYGQVRGENAIAMSPIARRNAAFMCRYDASEQISWQEIFKFPKQDVQLLGARRIKFTHDREQSLSDAMTEKFVALLTCDKKEFHGDFRRKPDGSYVLINRRRLGSTALGE